MSYSNLTNKYIPAHVNNYTKGRSGQKICKITPHHAAGNCSIETLGGIFQNSSRDASANYGIGTDGRIACYVDEENRSYCSSSASNDNRAITIEVANDGGAPNWSISENAFNALVNLCVDICKRYNFNLSYDNTSNGSLTRHNMFSATTCPGPTLQGRFPELVNLVNAQLSSSTESAYVTFVKSVQSATGAKIDGISGPETLSKTPTISKTKNRTHAVVKIVQTYLNFLGYDCGKVDGIAGPLFDSAVKKFQKANGCIVDGEITAKCRTWKKLLKLA